MARPKKDKTLYPSWAPTFVQVLSFDLHTLLGIPLDAGRRPSTGNLIVRTILRTITEALRRGETVTIRGFGQFRIAERRAYSKRGSIVLGAPMTLSSEPHHRAAKKYVIFRPALSFKAMLNADSPSYKERRQLRRWAPKS
jgi:nucleoid DNA-binding protein